MVRQKRVYPQQERLRAVPVLGRHDVVEERRCTSCHIVYAATPRTQDCPMCTAVFKANELAKLCREQAASLQHLQAKVRGLEASQRTMTGLHTAVSLVYGDSDRRDAVFLTTFFEERRDADGSMLLDCGTDGRPAFHVRVGEAGALRASHEMVTMGGVALATLAVPVAKLGGLARMTYALGTCVADHLGWPSK